MRRGFASRITVVTECVLTCGLTELRKKKRNLLKLLRYPDNMSA